MAHLKAFLFGSPRIEREDKPIHLSRRKTIALLAYLLVDQKIHTRESLAQLLWPGYDTSNGLANLRRELLHMKRAIGEHNLRIERDRIGLNPESAIWIDVSEFEAKISYVEVHSHPSSSRCSQCIEHLITATTLYRDDFLAGFSLPDSPSFDEWQFFRSEELQRSLIKALRQLIDWFTEAEDYPTAVQYGRRWLSLDMLHEPAHRQMMKLYALSGQTAAAIKQFNEFKRILEQELGVDPGEETIALYKTIQAKQFPPPHPDEEVAYSNSLAGNDSVLPSGTITLLYTDIEGSTPLWEQHPKSMEAALDHHNAILHRVASTHHGRVYKVVGDGFQIAFSSPIDAIKAATAAQTEFWNQDWGDIGALRVRMGIHTGEAEIDNQDYIPGLTFFRVSHIMSAGHGGQILASSVTAELLRDELSERLSLKDLGNHYFKGLSQAEHLYQVMVPGLPQDFPPLSTEKPQLHNLPTETSTFVGRQEDLSKVVNLLKGRKSHLITLLGPGGVGKSRLAIQVARKSLSMYKDGVWFVPLASLSSPDFLVSTIASAINISVSKASNPLQQLINFLQQKELLVILDNFEHMLPEGVSVPLELLNQTPSIYLLVTSRERLNLSSEWIYELKGLSFPVDDHVQTGSKDANIETSEAVQLFVQRARQARTGYAPARQDLTTILRICEMVEGLPLGIELAAAWMRSMSPQEIAREIEHNLDFLSTRMHNVPERHRSLRAVFEQTWKQLSSNEQKVLRKSSIFKGGWSREAAKEVTGASLPVLASLANRALLRVGHHKRYEMHNIIRLFGLKQLQFTPGEYEETHNRHMHHFMTFLQDRTQDLKGNRQVHTLEEIQREIDNIRAAWQWAVDRGDAPAFDQAAECLWLYYEYLGSLQEGEKVFQQAVEALQEVDSLTSEYANILGYLISGQGWLSARRGKVERGRALMEKGLETIRKSRSPDRRKEAMVVSWLGYVIMLQGEFIEAQRVMEEGLELCTQISDRWGMASNLRLMGTAAQFGGRFDEADRYLQRSLEISKQIGQQRIEAKAIMNQGVIAIWLGEYQHARYLLEKCVEISRQLNDLISLTDELRELSRVHLATGDYQRAIEILKETLSIYEVIGRVDRGAILGYLANGLFLAGDDHEAERLYEESLAASGQVGHHPEIAAALTGIGLIALSRQDYSQAQEKLEESLVIWQQSEHEPETSSIYRHLGHLARARGKVYYQEASRHYRSSLSLALKHQLAPIALDVLLGCSVLSINAKNKSDAIQLLYQILHHPASTSMTKKGAEKQLAKLTSNVPETPLEGTISTDQSEKWEQWAERALNDLYEIDN